MPKTGEDEGGWYITDGQGRGRTRVQYLSVAAVSVVGTVSPAGPLSLGAGPRVVSSPCRNSLAAAPGTYAPATGSGVNT